MICVLLRTELDSGDGTDEERLVRNAEKLGLDHRTKGGYFYIRVYIDEKNGQTKETREDASDGDVH